MPMIYPPTHVLRLRRQLTRLSDSGSHPSDSGPDPDSNIDVDTNSGDFSGIEASIDGSVKDCAHDNTSGKA